MVKGGVDIAFCLQIVRQHVDRKCVGSWDVIFVINEVLTLLHGTITDFSSLRDYNTQGNKIFTGVGKRRFLGSRRK
jgi:hypothetical protein